MTLEEPAQVGERGESVSREQVDAGETIVPAERLFECVICQEWLPAGQVYELNGQITCVPCYERTLGKPAQPTAAEAPAAMSSPVSGAAVLNAAQPTADEAPAAPPAHPVAKARPASRPLLLAKVTCPHCLQRFAPQDIFWVSRHPALLGDPIAGVDAPLRFLPSRFTADGAAIDLRGMPCQSLACPNCHLIVPRPLVEAEPLFTSTIGVSGSGKTCYLTTMIWQLRQLLPLHFGVSFTDADPAFNRALNRNEQTMFLAADMQQLVRLEKTATSGDELYDTVLIEQQPVNLPRPYLLTMRPSGRHPNAGAAAQLARVVYVYDNAGDHFSPGQDHANALLTQHVGSARVLQFLYDPTQDPRFRRRLRDMSNDPQLDETAPTRRQETVLIEAATRVREYAGLPATQKIDRPLIVVVPKSDVWGRLADLDLMREPILPGAVAGGVLSGVDVGRIEGISVIVRELLLDTAPEFVATAEDLFTHVVYIPVSALGTSPDAAGAVRPSQLRPMWATVPFLYMFARWSHDLIGGVRNAGVSR